MGTYMCAQVMKPGRDSLGNIELEPIEELDDLWDFQSYDAFAILGGVRDYANDYGRILPDHQRGLPPNMPVGEDIFSGVTWYGYDPSSDGALVPYWKGKGHYSIRGWLTIHQLLQLNPDDECNDLRENCRTTIGELAPTLFHAIKQTAEYLTNNEIDPESAYLVFGFD